MDALINTRYSPDKYVKNQWDCNVICHRTNMYREQIELLFKRLFNIMKSVFIVHRKNAFKISNYSDFDIYTKSLKYLNDYVKELKSTFLIKQIEIFRGKLIVAKCIRNCYKPILVKI